MTEETSTELQRLTPFEKMRQLASKVIAAPKSEVDRRQEEWKADRQRNGSEADKKQVAG